MDEDRLERLERRLAELEDERTIREMISRYAHFADLGYDDAWVGQWAEDGVYDLITVLRNGIGYAGRVVHEGRAELYEHMRDPVAAKAMEGRALHVQNLNLAIRVTGDDAVAESYSMTLMREGDATVLHSAGMIRWEFRRIDGAWRISVKKRRPIGDRDMFPDIAPAPA
jgi:hypothetical protein